MLTWDDKITKLAKVMIMLYSLLWCILFSASVFLLTINRFMNENIVTFDLNLLFNSGLLVIFYSGLLLFLLFILFNIKEYIVDIIIDIFSVEDLISVFFVSIIFTLVFLISMILKPNLFTYTSFIWSIISPCSLILQPAYTTTIFYRYNKYIFWVGSLGSLIGFITSYVDIEYLTIINTLLTVLGSLLTIITQPLRVIKSEKDKPT